MIGDHPAASAADLAAAVRAMPGVALEHLMALIDRTTAVIYMRDLDGRYMLVNRQYEKLFGLRREDIVGLTDHDLFPPEIADAFRANDLDALRSPEPLRMEEMAPGDDGMRTYITVKFSLTDAAGRAYAVAGISTDITEQKRAEEEVRRLNAELERRVRFRTAELEASTRELDAFAYSVSHDLRAPLRAMEGYAEILRDEYGDRLDEEGRRYLARVQANAVRMAQMIDDLLHLSRAARIEMSRERTDLNVIIDQALEDLRQLEPDRRVAVEVQPGLVAEGDPALIALVVQNLISNAWKFTGRTPDARITVDSPAPGEFRFADNGAGFDMDYAEKLFDPFQRLHTTSDFEGTGIGLAIVHRIVRRHGGHIRAEGRPGHGATFWVSFGGRAS